MDYFAGLDVSVKETSVCIVDDMGKIIREVKVASEPKSLLAALLSLSRERPLSRLEEYTTPTKKGWLVHGRKRPVPAFLSLVELGRVLINAQTWTNRTYCELEVGRALQHSS